MYGLTFTQTTCGICMLAVELCANEDSVTNDVDCGAPFVMDLDGTKMGNLSAPAPPGLPADSPTPPQSASSSLLQTRPIPRYGKWKEGGTNTSVACPRSLQAGNCGHVMSRTLHWMVAAVVAVRPWTINRRTAHAGIVRPESASQEGEVADGMGRRRAGQGREIHARIHGMILFTIHILTSLTVPAVSRSPTPLPHLRCVYSMISTTPLLLPVHLPQARLLDANNSDSLHDPSPISVSGRAKGGVISTRRGSTQRGRIVDLAQEINSARFNPSFRNYSVWDWLLHYSGNRSKNPLYYCNYRRGAVHKRISSVPGFLGASECIGQFGPMCSQTLNIVRGVKLLTSFDPFTRLSVQR
ncbi:hypothetical protein B0H10DRAFT_2379717 [Mycena sp. CBHHK59/15]|nr:hypothetical protein B0H10DRAFT_2379717 [Mycena sp. CBHHK59/15]